MIRLVFLFLILLPFQSFSAQNEYKIYKVIEIKKDELNNAITSIPIFGDILKKDEIKNNIIVIQEYNNKIIVQFKKREKTFKNKKLFQISIGINKYEFDLVSNTVEKLNENQKVIKKYTLEKIVETNDYSKTINLLNKKIDIVSKELNQSQILTNNKNQEIKKLESELKNLSSLNVDLEEENKSRINNKNQEIKKLESELKNLISLNVDLEEENKSGINNKNQVIEKLENELKNVITLTEKVKNIESKSQINIKNTIIKKLETELKKIKEENKSQINNKKIIIEKLKTQLKNLNEKLIEESKPFYKKLIPKKE